MRKERHSPWPRIILLPNGERLPLRCFGLTGEPLYEPLLHALTELRATNKAVKDAMPLLGSAGPERAAQAQGIDVQRRASALRMGVQRSLRGCEPSTQRGTQRGSGCGVPKP